MRKDVTTSFDEALRLHQAGRSAEAEPIYRRIIAAEPAHADALHLLGVVLLQQGDAAGAVDLIERAVDALPSYAEAYNNRGIALQALGAFDRAGDSFLRSLALEPANAEALNNYGVLCLRQRFRAIARAMLEKAVMLAPGFAQAQNNLGKALEATDALPEAVHAYRRAAELAPDHAEAWNNLGNLLQLIGRPDQAAACYLNGLARAPHYVSMYGNLGAALQSLGQLDQAIGVYHRGLAIDPAQVAAHVNLANVRHVGGDPAGSEASARLALALDPAIAEAHNNLGNALRDQGRLEEAIASYERAIQRKPSLAEAHNNIGAVTASLGEHEAAIAHYRRALATKPDYVSAHTNLVQATLYDARVTCDDIYNEVRRFEAVHALPRYGRARRPANSRDPDRRLRIGYLSANLRSHVVSLSLEPLFRAHDRAAFELACYAQVARPDAASAVFRQHSRIWRSIVALSDEQVADQIAADGIDILVSVAGWFDGNRPLICAYRPAPVQVTLFDAATSGIAAMDYWLTDGFLHPEHTRDRFTERLERVDHLITYPPPLDAPPVAQPSSTMTGQVTFGSCNNPAKITAATIALWARVLAGVSGAILVFKYLNWFANERLRGRIVGQFAQHGIGAERLVFETGARERAQHFARVSSFDVSLDTHPFTGCTTTFESLCMGVPVVTLAGDRLVSRLSGSLLTTLGLDDLIANDGDDFVRRAVAIAGNIERRRMLRDSLRQRIMASPLCDAAAYAQSVGAAYRRMWRRWCAERPARS